jgi:predicted dehydrogenase
MKIQLVACVALATLTLAAPAQAAFKGCYERVYDARYLKKNKKQKVIRMRFQIGVGQGEDGPPELADRIDATLRGKSIYRGSGVSCEADGKELECTIVGEGGAFRVTPRPKNSLRITNTNSLRFGPEGSGDTVKADRQNREFRLFRVGTGPCL